MKFSSLFFFYLVFVLSSLLLWRASPVAAVTCNPLQLTPCADAILKSAPPSSACCSKLKEQKPCFCQYQKNPSLSGYVNSKNGKRVAGACGVPIPKC